jgi:hypothetical protein
MASLFKVMSALAALDSEEIENEQPCKERLQRVDTLNSVVRKGVADLIVMAAEPGAATKLAGDPENEEDLGTHVAVLFILDKAEYTRVNDELDVIETPENNG